MAKQAELLSVDDARERILGNFNTLPAEKVPLRDASGRVLASDVVAPINIPPFANSSMDGFAMRTADTATACRTSPTVLSVVDSIAAGQYSTSQVIRGTCARIMTGAPLPPGADGVVPFELVEEHGDTIVVAAPILPGACVRLAGQDVVAGRNVLERGAVIEATQIGLLASLGFAFIDVVRSPLVAILSTGDELVAPGQQLRPGQIYNSNSPMLIAAVREAGGTPIVLPTTRDNIAALRAAVEEGRNSDLLLTSGGASVGDFDHVKSVIGETGEVGIWRVRLKPGKPLIFGHVGTTPIIGLPGNPTSAFVTFEQFARPAIRTMLGLPPMRPVIHAILDHDMDNEGDRRTYARVRLHYRDGRYHVSSSGPQDSAMLVPLAHADGLMEMREEQHVIRAGDDVLVQVWHLPN